MDFFDKLGKKASETYKATAEMTGKLAKEAKFKLKMGELRTDAKEIYEEIGKKVYLKHEEGKKSLDLKKDLDEDLSKLDEIASELATIEKACLVMSGKKKCVNCSLELGRDVKFCPECGTEQPIEKEDEEVILEAEVIVDENAGEEAEPVEEEKVEEVKEEKKEEDKKD